MAIQTGGFRLSVMPRFTGADPSLVGFNPTAATAGASQGIQMAALIDQIKAQRAAQEEEAAIRDGRIAATIAKNRATVAKSDADIPLFGAESGLRLGQIGKKLGLLDKEAEAAGLGYDASMARDAATVKTAPVLADTEIAKAAADKAAAEGRATLQPLVDDVAGLQLENKFNDMVANAPTELQLRAANLENDLATAKTAQERAKIVNQLKDDLMRAQIKNFDAESEYKLRTPDKTKPVEDVEQDIISNLAKMADLRLKNGETLGAYFQNRTNDKWFDGKPDSIDPESEKLADRYQALLTQLIDLRGRRPATPAVKQPSASNSFANEQELQKALDSGSIKVGDSVIVNGVKGTIRE